MEKQEDENDKVNQESKSNPPSNEKNERKDPLHEMIMSVLQELNEQRLQRAIKKPHIEAKFQALKYRPVQFFTLSNEEKNRIFQRREQWIELKILSNPKLLRPKKPLPPKQPTLQQKRSEILWDENPNVIAGECSQLTSKSSKNEENLNPYKAATHNPVYNPIKNLFEMTKMRKGIQSLERKIYAVLHNGADIVFKNDDKEAKKSFYEWVKDCNDLVRLNSIKTQAVNPGISISHFILDIMFLLSENNADESGAKFQAFEDALSWIDRDENTVVIGRLLDLMKATESKLRLKKNREMAGRRLKAVQESNDDDDLEESFIDFIMHHLLDLIFRLELFWVHRRLPCSRWALIEAFPSLEAEVDKFQLPVMLLGGEIEDSVEDAKFGEVDINWRDCNDYMDMDIKVDELWHI